MTFLIVCLCSFICTKQNKNFGQVAACPRPFKTIFRDLEETLTCSPVAPTLTVLISRTCRRTGETHRQVRQVCQWTSDLSPGGPGPGPYPVHCSGPCTPPESQTCFRFHHSRRTGSSGRRRSLGRSRTLGRRRGNFPPQASTYRGLTQTHNNYPQYTWQTGGLSLRITFVLTWNFLRRRQNRDSWRRQTRTVSRDGHS